MACSKTLNCVRQKRYSRSHITSAALTNVGTNRIPNVPGHTLTTVTVDLAPVHLTSVHTHNTFVYVCVLEGGVRIQLGNAKPIKYSARDSWIEHPGVSHTLT